MDILTPLPSSFRDPCGVVFEYNKEIYRNITIEGKDDYDLLLSSGLYKKLIDSDLLVKHDEVDEQKFNFDNSYKVIKPSLIPFISFPHEWTFLQLKAAALLTLKIQKIAMSFNLSLKDASAYNIQFLNGKAIFIDTLSFEKYKKGAWQAYGQFCEHFLGPLSLRKYKSRSLSKLSQSFIEGIPLPLISNLLPIKSWLNLGVLMHIHLHAKMKVKYADVTDSEQINNSSNKQFSQQKLLALIESLIGITKSLKLKIEDSQWKDYYQCNNYQDAALEHKQKLVEQFIEEAGTQQNLIADVGANTGVFSRIASKYANHVLAFDFDESAVELNYLYARKNNEKNILPLVLDVMNPSPAIGWDCNERESIFQRANFDTVLSLALIHHLAISNNLPLEKIIKTFYSLTNEYWIVEFVPKEDSQVQRLLATREDIFPNYNLITFESSLHPYFNVIKKENISSSTRTVFLLQKIIPQ